MNKSCCQSNRVTSTFARRCASVAGLLLPGAVLDANLQNELLGLEQIIALHPNDEANS